MSRWVSLLSVLLGGTALAGCALLTPLPPPTSVDQRLEALPTRGLPLRHPVTIYWNDHKIPFIEAIDDGDAAFALGLVHAHLRLGQMAVYKRVAAGRISEMGGPAAVDIDHGLRLLDFGRAAPAIAASLPAPTRDWLQRFVDGVNHYQASAVELPIEYRILGLAREPWTVGDVITFGRLAGSDINWVVWMNVVRLRHRDDWPQLWARLVANGGAAPAAADAGGGLGEVLAGISRSGSNSLAVAPARTTTGAAIMANDPHLGISIPNVWLIAGVKSPSLHAVGLMVPGLPVFAIGRNERISWGGTYMRAAASDLVDAGTLDPASIRERRERLRVRWWFDRYITIRETPWGPRLSDAPQLADAKVPPFALRWTGHEVSDEFSAMLAMNRADTFEAFRGAFRTFAVPGQNMLYADVDGNIGQVMAVRLPARGRTPPADLIVEPESVERDWRERRGVGDLPVRVNPKAGFLASANNRPPPTDVPIGWFFSPDDRVDRMAELVGSGAAVGIDDIKRLQKDVFMASSVQLRDVLVARLDALGVTAAAGDDAQRRVIDLMRRWDGHYDAASQGAVAFELMRHAVTRAFYAARLGEEDWAAFASFGRIQAMLIEDIEAADPGWLAVILKDSVAAAARRIDDHAAWGDMHLLDLRHPLAFLPVVGGRFRFGSHGVGGSSDTLMKTAHGLTDERHAVRYGANARHISDMSDPDRNDFVLIGGQDGWFNSAAFLDQVPLWLRGDYIRVPLRIDSVRRQFPYVTALTP